MAALRSQRAPVPLAVQQCVEVTDFGANPGALRMLAYTPQRRAAQAPLVVVLHGCTQTAEGYAAGAGWLTLAEECGFVIVCPEQQRANNPNLCFNWFRPHDTRRASGEAASIHAMVRHALATYDLDPRRVYITGLSAGAAMANVMLATYPEAFAAGALIAGLPYGAAGNVQQALAAMAQPQNKSDREWGDKVRAASAHVGPWPRVSIWRGDADATVRPGASDDITSQWRDVHAIETPALHVTSPAGRPYRVWRAHDGAPAVELHTIAAMGHGAPLHTADGYGEAGPYLLDVGVSSTLEIAQGWGLASNRARPRAAAPDAWRRPHPGFAVPPASGPGEVIASALRAAGLMK